MLKKIKINFHKYKCKCKGSDRKNILQISILIYFSLKKEPCKIS